MQVVTENYGAQSPEKLIHRLVAQLGNHALWDALLIFLPPLIVAIYLLVYFFQAAWIGPLGLFLMIVTVAGLVLLAVLFRYRPLVPSVGSAARLVDDHTGAKDRFLTLLTIEPSPNAASLVSRLRMEAAQFQTRIELKRDFPFQIKGLFTGRCSVRWLRRCCFICSCRRCIRSFIHCPRTSGFVSWRRKWRNGRGCRSWPVACKRLQRKSRIRRGRRKKNRR